MAYAEVIARDGDHWVMFYFGVGHGGAHIMAAFSRDLLHWTAHPEPQSQPCLDAPAVAGRG